MRTLYNVSKAAPPHDSYCRLWPCPKGHGTAPVWEKKCGTLCQILIILSIEISFNKGLFSCRTGSVQKYGQRPGHINLAGKPIPLLHGFSQTVLLGLGRRRSRACWNIHPDHTSSTLSRRAEKIDRELRAHQRHQQVFPPRKRDAALLAAFPYGCCELLRTVASHPHTLSLPASDRKTVRPTWTGSLR